MSDVPIVSHAGKRCMKSSAKYESGVCMVGVFPPPVHGMAMVNAGMYELLCSRGVVPFVLNLAPASLKRSWFNRLGRIPSVAKAFLRYLRKILDGNGITLYIGLSGGWGQIYEALFVAMARLRRARIFLHHHSFAYLDRRRLPALLLVRLAGPSATHIVLCERQGQRLTQCYPTASQTRVVSNAAILPLAGRTTHRNRTGVERIGFLGNISREKGIMEVLAIAERLEAQDAGFELYIAGPFENSGAENAVKQTGVRLRTVKYLGPRYGPEKESYWDLIDVLLFPSRYRHETAPLAVYEAMAHAIPVVAWERGCLSDIVPPAAGLLVPCDQDFVAVAVDQLLKWRRDPTGFAEMPEAAAKDFIRQREKYSANLQGLLDELSPSPARLT